MKNSLNSPSVTRRQFVAGSLTALGISPVITMAKPQKSPSLVPGQANTVQEVIDTILKAIPGGSISQTVDTLKAGNGNEPVTGIVSTMFATVEVIRKAVDLKANFIIVHEPTFYSHTDETSWLESDRVYGFKRDLLQIH